MNTEETLFSRIFDACYARLPAQTSATALLHSSQQRPALPADWLEQVAYEIHQLPFCSAGLEGTAFTELGCMTTHKFPIGSFLRDVDAAAAAVEAAAVPDEATLARAIEPFLCRVYVAGPEDGVRVQTFMGANLVVVRRRQLQHVLQTVPGVKYIQSNRLRMGVRDQCDDARPCRLCRRTGCGHARHHANLRDAPRTVRYDPSPLSKRRWEGLRLLWVKRLHEWDCPTACSACRKTRTLPAPAVALKAGV